MNARVPAGLCMTALVCAGCGSGDLWRKHVIEPAREGQSMIHTAVASDFDGDGHVDILTSFDRHVYVYPGPDWTRRVSVHAFKAGQSRRKPSPACIHSTLLDVDGDGDMDFCGSNQTVFWLECPDRPFDAPWTYRTIDDEILGTHCLITGDVDRDGKPDLIANSGRPAPKTTVPDSIVWLPVPKAPREAKSWTRHVFADRDAPGGSHYMGFGDVNGDGRPDIACGAKGGEKFPGGEWFAWWEQPADPTAVWTKHVLSDKQPGASNILPVDLDGDGRTDFLASRGHSSGLLWFRAPDFKPVVIDAKIVGPHCLLVADLDRDGDPDAATCGRDADGVAAWYENNGKGRLRKHVIGRNQGSYDIRAVDLDGDGDLDLLIAGHASRNLVWYENPLLSPGTN